MHGPRPLCTWSHRLPFYKGRQTSLPAWRINPNNHGNLRGPPLCHPPQEIRPYSGTINHRFPLIRALFLGGGGFGGVPLDFHDNICYLGTPPKTNMSMKKSPIFTGNTSSNGCFFFPLSCLCPGVYPLEVQPTKQSGWSVGRSIRSGFPILPMGKPFVRLGLPGGIYVHLRRFFLNKIQILNKTGWWFQPIWKILVKLEIFPKEGWKEKIFETTPRKKTFWTNSTKQKFDE